MVLATSWDENTGVVRVLSFPVGGRSATVNVSIGTVIWMQSPRGNCAALPADIQHAGAAMYVRPAGFDREHMRHDYELLLLGEAEHIWAHALPLQAQAVRNSKKQCTACRPMT